MTWSIVARDPSGALGVVVASRFFAVGALCPYAHSGVGALSTQALLNPLYGPRGLALLSQGMAPNDVVIADRKASRVHAHIERRRDKFVLIDHSSNGTWVTADGKAEVTLRREELILRGRGHISFGHAFGDDPAEVLAFACLE